MDLASPRCAKPVRAIRNRLRNLKEKTYLTQWWAMCGNLPILKNLVLIPVVLPGNTQFPENSIFMNFYRTLFSITLIILFILSVFLNIFWNNFVDFYSLSRYSRKFFIPRTFSIWPKLVPGTGLISIHAGPRLILYRLTIQGVYLIQSSKFQMKIEINSDFHSH